MIDENQLLKKLDGMNDTVSYYRQDVRTVAQNLICEISDYIKECVSEEKQNDFNRESKKQEEPVNITFPYIAKRIKFGTEKEMVLGGFQKLDKAEKYVESIEDNFLFSDYLRGTFVIDSPKGRYIYGCEIKENRNVWYEPGQTAYVYDCKRDCVMHLDDVHSNAEKPKAVKKTKHTMQR